MVKLSPISICETDFEASSALTTLCVLQLYCNICRNYLVYFNLGIYLHNGETSLCTKELLSFAMSRVFSPKQASILNMASSELKTLSGIVIFVSTKVVYFNIVIYRHNGETSLYTKELLSFAMPHVFSTKTGFNIEQGQLRIENFEWDCNICLNKSGLF